MSHFGNETLFFFAVQTNILLLARIKYGSHHKGNKSITHKKIIKIMEIDNCNQTSIAKDQENIFLYTTITGNLRLLHLEQIVYFRYDSHGKQWEVILYNGRSFILKRNTNSQKILNLHPHLVQISQSHIININYLVSIEDNNCILHPPFHEREPLQISKSFMKKIKEKYPCI